MQHFAQPVDFAMVDDSVRPFDLVVMAVVFVVAAPVSIESVRHLLDVWEPLTSSTVTEFCTRQAHSSDSHSSSFDSHFGQHSCLVDAVVVVASSHAFDPDDCNRYQE